VDYDRTIDLKEIMLCYRRLVNISTIVQLKIFQFEELNIRISHVYEVQSDGLITIPCNFTVESLVSFLSCINLDVARNNNLSSKKHLQQVSNLCQTIKSRLRAKDVILFKSFIAIGNKEQQLQTLDNILKECGSLVKLSFRTITVTITGNNQYSFDAEHQILAIPPNFNCFQFSLYLSEHQDILTHFKYNLF